MQTLEIRENLISQLKELHNKKAFLPNIEFNNLNLSDLKKEIQLKLNSLKSSSKIPVHLPLTQYSYSMLLMRGRIQGQ